MEKKNNIAIIMGIIIMLLIIFIILLATNTINFRTQSKIDHTNNDTKPVGEQEYVLSKNEAEAIAQNLLTNRTVRRIIDNSQLTYCPDYDVDVIYNERDLGLNYEWNGYNKCKSFHSYGDLTNYFKTFFTDDYYNNSIENKGYVATEYKTRSDGTVMYNYYEKDGELYVAVTGKGSNIDKYDLYSTTYVINNISATEINATASFTWLDSNSNEWVEKVDIILKKINDIWKIDSYETKKI